MQFFGFINTLVRQTRKGKLFDYSIVRYPVIPLSTEIGLAGWVLRADTMHSVVQDYRKKRGIRLNVELKLYKDNDLDFERLKLKDKIIFFKLECFSLRKQVVNGTPVGIIMHDH